MKEDVVRNGSAFRQHFAIWSIAALCIGAVARADQSGFQITTVTAPSGYYVSDIAQAERLLQGSIPAQSTVTSTFTEINFADPQDPGGSFHFDGKVPFPGDTPGIDQNFAMLSTGTINIPSPGDYTFGVNSDDGFKLTIGSFNLEYDFPREGADSLATFHFSQAGDYPLSLVYFQQWAQSHVELYAAPGSFASFDAPGSDFQLVNADGTLSAAAPEPSALGLLAMGVSIPLLRRRRR